MSHISLCLFLLGVLAFLALIFLRSAITTSTPVPYFAVSSIVLTLHAGLEYVKSPV